MFKLLPNAVSHTFFRCLVVKVSQFHFRYVFCKLHRREWIVLQLSSWTYRDCLLVSWHLKVMDPRIYKPPFIINFFHSERTQISLEGGLKINNWIPKTFSKERMIDHGKKLLFISTKNAKFFRHVRTLWNKKNTSVWTLARIIRLRIDIFRGCFKEKSSLLNSLESHFESLVIRQQNNVDQNNYEKVRLTRDLFESICTQDHLKIPWCPFHFFNWNHVTL